MRTKAAHCTQRRNNDDEVVLSPDDPTAIDQDAVADQVSERDKEVRAD